LVWCAPPPPAPPSTRPRYIKSIFASWIDSEFGLVRTSPSYTTFYSPQVHKIHFCQLD
jgi:hypothetical protein